MDKAKAQFILTAIESGFIGDLESAGIRVYGNKGRMWKGEACITDLDPIKGQCNPRLAFNSCGLEDIGCPKCMDTLRQLAAGELVASD